MPSVAYESHKRQTGQRQRRQTTEGRDIGGVGFVADPERRRRAAADFRVYCETYHRPTFHLEWSPDHLKVIGQIQSAVLGGGLFATAMPRGSGKTSLAEKACEWAVLNGYHPFVCLIGSDEGAAVLMLESIKTEFEVNDLLADDYPEVCIPIAKLEGIANRCSGQSYGGERTRIEWTEKAIVMPSLKPAGWDERPDHRDFLRPDGSSLASGAILKVAGLTGGIRGMKHKRADGKTVRPSLVVPDDPQTDGSARSPSQCATRERILAGAVLGLAGPGSKIAGIMPCTVIRAGDMADNILDRKKHPEWHGTRTKLVYAFPKAEKHWEEYARLRREAMEAELPPTEATEYYADRRAVMDEGAIVAWTERFNDDELSAVQNAMNLLYDRGPHAFHAEYQNSPLPEVAARPDDLDPDQVAAKLNRLSRGVAPVGATRLTAFIDVHASVLYYAVCAWEDDFTGYLIDCGTYPDQKRAYFTLREAKITLEKAVKAPDLEGRLFAGLEATADLILGREWPTEGGTTMRVDRCLVDANWGPQTNLVYEFCRRSAHAGTLTPSHGRGIRASWRPMREYSRKPGDRVGRDWRMDAAPGKRAIRKVLFDANAWKSFLQARLNVPLGSRSCFSLFGSKADAHRLLADHLTSESAIPNTAQGRTVDEWSLKVGRDNHWLDAVIGCCVAASIEGVALAESSGTATKAAGSGRKRLSFAEMRAKRATDA